MKRNVASQVIGVQAITAADGTAFTGSVVVSVTGDGGTQAAGSVGSGACTHEGNGFHTYAPAQAETNYDHVAFTFTGTGMIPATVQVYTNYPQSADNATNIGAIKTVTDALPDSGALTSLATASALATVDTVVDGIQTDLSNGTDGLGAIKADTAAILTDTGTTIPASIAALPTAAENRAEIDSNSTQLAAIVTDTGTTIPAQISGLNNVAATDIVSGGAITTSAGAVSNVTLVATTTTNTDMRGTDSAATASALATIDSNVDAILADTADMQPKLGTPSGVSMSADIAAVKVDTAATLVDTNELQGDWTNGGRLDLLIDAIKVVTDALPDSGALTSLATAANLATVDGNVDSILVDTGTSIPATLAALNDLAASDILTTQLTESYAADGTAPTLAQAIFLIQQFLCERATSGTTVTVAKLDGATTAATLTLDDATTPTSITRAT